MKKYKNLTKSIIPIFLIGVALFPVMFLKFQPVEYNYNYFKTHPMTINTSSTVNMTNAEIIDEIFTKYIDHHGEYGYYPSYYTPSMQGTYYALSILSALDRMDSVNQNHLSKYIMDHYNASSGIFMDDYARRYLDTDFSMRYYALSSLLEVNAYAILSLHLLGKVYLIDFQKTFNFIWDCFNSTLGGFAGRQLNPNLSPYFNQPTLDNTYYAVKTLDLLLDSWEGYTTEKSAIVDFITSTQNLNPNDNDYGGFHNNPRQNYRFLDHHDPSIHSCYYALKVLELFGTEDIIDSDAFHSYLSERYQADKYYFKISSSYSFENQCIYSATAIGLELSLITAYTNIDETGIIDFLLLHRNDIGIWDITDSDKIYELIDTFQVIRSLSDIVYLGGLESSERDRIKSAVDTFQSAWGYSFMAQKYTKVGKIYSLAESFRMYDKIGDLEILELYYAFEDAYWEYSYRDTRVFYGFLNANGQYAKFRLNPIEFNSYGSREHINHIDYLPSHKWTYLAMNAMNKMFKLDDFDNYHNLTELLDCAIACQITNTDSDKFGGFLPYDYINLYPIEIQEKFTYFDHAYYAIKTIEFLTDWLGVGSVLNTDVDTNALYTYLSPFIVESPTTLYCVPEYVTGGDKELCLKHTYFMAELYRILNYGELNAQKIKKFVQTSINYSNIENIYYCYKLDEMFSLNTDFDLHLTHQLIKDIYDSSLGELYLTPDRHEIDPKTFYWICYIAQHDEYRLKVDYTSIVPMGGQFNLSARISNVVLDTINSYQTLKLESDLMGTHYLRPFYNGSFKLSLDIPFNTNLYPTVDAELNLYEGPFLLFSYPLTFRTTYDLKYGITVLNRSEGQEFRILAGFLSPEGYCYLEHGEASIKTYINGTFVHKTTLVHKNSEYLSQFTTIISVPSYGEYLFEIYLMDGINTTAHRIDTYRFDYEVPQETKPIPSKDICVPGYLITPPVLVSLIIITFGLIRLDRRLIRKKTRDPQQKNMVEKTNAAYEMIGELEGDDTFEETLWENKQTQPT